MCVCVYVCKWQINDLKHITLVFLPSPLCHPMIRLQVKAEQITLHELMQKHAASEAECY
jgi:hypothetical protein